MRVKDKIEKYIDKLVKQYPVVCTIVEASKSRYYNVNGRVLRISDHIGANSSGVMSIIIPGFASGGNYILHAHTSGQLSIIPYESVKEVVRSFFFISSMMTEIVQNTFKWESEKCETFNTNEEVKKLKAQNKRLENYKKKMVKATNGKADKNLIMGIERAKFDDKHLDIIDAILDKMKRTGVLNEE